MASPFPIIQEFLAGTLGSESSHANLANESYSAFTSPTSTIPTDLLSLLSALVSIYALREWLILIVIGGFLESCRRLGCITYDKVINSFCITAEFEEDDDSYGMHSIICGRTMTYLFIIIRMDDDLAL